MGRRKKPPHPDPEWLALAERTSAPHGVRQRLAKALNVHTATVSRIVHGENTTPDLMLRLSLELGIRPPKSVPLDIQEQEALSVMTHLRRVAGPDHFATIVAKLSKLAYDVDEMQRFLDTADVSSPMFPKVVDMIGAAWREAGFPPSAIARRPDDGATPVAPIAPSRPRLRPAKKRE